MDSNAAPTHGQPVQVSNGSSADGGPPLSPKQQLAQQIASGNFNSEDGVFAQLRSNPFFTAGIGIGALGFLLTTGRQSLSRASALLRRRLLIDVEITRHDESYQWFLQWMSAYTRAQLSHPRPSSQRQTLTSRILRRLTPGIHHLSMQTSRTSLPSGSTGTHFALVPGPGRHILRYRNAFLLVRREREAGTVDLQSGRPFETVTLTTLYSQRHIFADLFQEAHAAATQQTEGKTKIYVPQLTKWVEFGAPKRKRPLESVALAEGVKERIVEDVRAFLASRNWYLDRGIPYRRGYLLYGPPGTGKTSFIQALAGELDFNIAMLNLSQRGLVDDQLSALLTNLPARTLVLLEDADAAFVNRRQVGEDGYAGATVTFSGLLNALDGVASAEERVVFLTTNFVERLDAALVRPGRVDMTVRLGEATRGQVAVMWERFYGVEDGDGEGVGLDDTQRNEVEQDKALKEAFIQRLEELGLLGKVSMAALQGLFLFNKDNPRGAVDMVEGLLPEKGSVGQTAAQVEPEPQAPAPSQQHGGR